MDVAYVLADAVVGPSPIMNKIEDSNPVAPVESDVTKTPESGWLRVWDFGRLAVLFPFMRLKNTYPISSPVEYKPRT